jgi:hypothetical protein
VLGCTARTGEVELKPWEGIIETGGDRWRGASPERGGSSNPRKVPLIIVNIIKKFTSKNTHSNEGLTPNHSSFLSKGIVKILGKKKLP